MKGLENHTYLVLYIISNIIAILMLWASWKHSRLLRFMLLIVFVWASWTNWNEAIVAPQFYMDSATLPFSGFSRHILHGWFSKHITLVVGFIATYQALIAVSMLLKGWIFEMGIIGGIVFLLAIAPLGVGAAFPCTVILAIALWRVLRIKETDYLWLVSPGKEI